MLKRACVYIARLALLLTVLVPLLSVPAGTVQAATHSFSQTSDQTSGHVTIIVLDMSGSMSTNDPDGLRCSAANAYIDLSGPNDYIGLVGLNNTDGSTGGTYNFELAQKWQDPINTAVLRERQTLRSAIDSNSNHCAPGGNTPTYDALNQALTMLTDTKAKHPGLSGSVVLLTDGTPAPDTNAQINDINATLVPQFKSHTWPIDTIALGQDGPVEGMGDLTFHQFLKNISNATGGDAYDDGQGDVSGISPLNIAPFFVTIFGKRVGRTVNQDIPPTSIPPDGDRENFPVTELASSLDVVVIKENSQTQVNLVTPSGASITDTSGGATVSQDPHYVLYSINQPTAGQWEVDVSGSGRFSLYSLKKSNIAVHVDSVVPTKIDLRSSQNKDIFPLNQSITVSASLTNDGNPVTVGTYQLQGTISNGSYSQTFPLNDNAKPGTYTADVTVPDSAPAGTYDIQIIASTVSAQAPISSASYPVRLELFPVPSFVNPKTQQPTTDSFDVSVIQWPVALQVIYSIPPFSLVSGWPLQQHPPLPLADIDGVLQWKGNLYTQASIKEAGACPGSSSTPIKANACPDGSTPIHVNVTQDGQGHFHAQFQPPQSGAYTITFQTGGSFKDSQGEFGPQTSTLNITVGGPSDSQLTQAWLTTLFILLMLIFLVYLLKFWLTPAPFGEWVRAQGGERMDGRKFSRGHRGLFQWFFHRNILNSRQVGMPQGLQFRFRWGRGIDVRSQGSGSTDWQSGDGSKLRDQFQRVRELVFYPRGSADSDTEASSQFTILAQSNGWTPRYGGDSYDDDYDAERNRRSQSRRSRRSRSIDSSPSYDSPPFLSQRTKKRVKRGRDLYDDLDDY